MINKIPLLLLFFLHSTFATAQTDSISGKNKNTVVFEDNLVTINNHIKNDWNIISVNYKSHVIAIDTSLTSDEAEIANIDELILNKNKRDTLLSRKYIIRGNTIVVSTFNTAENRATQHVINTQNGSNIATISGRNAFITGNYIVTFRLDMEEEENNLVNKLIISSYSMADFKYRNKVVKIKKPVTDFSYFSGEYTNDLQLAKLVWKYLHIK